MRTLQIDLISESLLGHWEVRPGVMQCEQQFGSRLIYVQHPSGEPPHRRLAAAQQQVQAVWDDVPGALDFAGHLCEPAIGALWRLYQHQRLLTAPLAVYSIHFDIDNPHPCYTISQNPDFDWRGTLTIENELAQPWTLDLAELEPENDFWLSIRRLGQGQFERDA